MHGYENCELKYKKKKGKRKIYGKNGVGKVDVQLKYGRYEERPLSNTFIQLAISRIPSFAKKLLKGCVLSFDHVAV